MRGALYIILRHHGQPRHHAAVERALQPPHRARRDPAPGTHLQEGDRRSRLAQPPDHREHHQRPSGHRSDRRPADTTGQITNFVVTSPFNIAAKNKGAEFSWQKPLGGGFGALANYTYADGHAADGTPLVGSSKNTANGELYFERWGLSARVAYTYRSSFLVGLANVTPQYEAGIGTPGRLSQLRGERAPHVHLRRPEPEQPGAQVLFQRRAAAGLLLQRPPVLPGRAAVAVA